LTYKTLIIDIYDLIYHCVCLINYSSIIAITLSRETIYSPNNFNSLYHMILFFLTPRLVKPSQLNWYLCYLIFKNCISLYIVVSCSRMQYWRGNSTPTKDRQRPTRITLPLIDQMFAVLVRLRLGLLLNDIADRFSIPVSSFSNMFTTWICLMYEELKLINIFSN